MTPPEIEKVFNGVSLQDFLDSTKIESKELSKVMKMYQDYKRKYMKNIKFDPNASRLSM